MIRNVGSAYVYCGAPSSKEASVLKSAGFRLVKGKWSTTDPCCITRSTELIRMCDPDLTQKMIALRNKMIGLLELSNHSGQVPLDVVLPEGRELMPFQTAGVSYMLSAGRALNACPMGLGKSPMGAVCIKALFDKGHAKTALIVCPASLKRNWQIEIKAWTGFDSEVVHSKWKPVRCRIAIINYDILKKFEAWLGSIQWDILLGDEVHFVKSYKAGRTKEFMKIGSRYFFALSGTPMPNNPSELFPVLHKMRPDIFPDRWRFCNDYCYIIKEFGHMKIVGGKNLERLKNKMRATCMFRVKKEEVLKDLPPKRRQIIEVENTLGKLTEAEIDAFDQTARLKVELKDMKVKCEATHDVEAHRDMMEAFAAKTQEYQASYGQLSTARKELAISKVPICLEHILSVLESEDKLVVFVYHKDAGYSLEASINKAGIKAAFMCGDTPSDARQEMAQDFMKGDLRVLIGSFGAMGTGWTLTAASVSVFTELDWVPATLDQSEDRIHRIGQVNPVLIQYLVLQNSLDSKMIRKLVVKGRLIEQVME